MKSVLVTALAVMTIGSGAFAAVSSSQQKSLESAVPAGTRQGTVTAHPGDGFVSEGMACSITATYGAKSVEVTIDVPNAGNGDNNESIIFEQADSTMSVSAPSKGGATQFSIQEPYHYKDEDGSHSGISKQKIVVGADGSITAGPDFSCKPN